MPLRVGGLPVSGGPPDLPGRRERALAGHLAVAGRRRAVHPPRPGRAVAAGAAARAGGRRQPRAARVRARRPRRSREVGSETSEPTRWEVVEDPSTGEVAVHTHEASVSVLPDGVSTPVRRRDAHDGRLRRASRARAASRTTASTASRARAIGSWSSPTAGSAPPSTAFDMTAHLRVDLDGEPFFERTWREEIAARPALAVRRRARSRAHGGRTSRACGASGRSGGPGGRRPGTRATPRGRGRTRRSGPARAARRTAARRRSAGSAGPPRPGA